jgi:SSS family solute:Na+ symporter
MGVTGAIYFAGAFALLVCGLYWKRASSTGAFLALLAGSSAILGLGPIQEIVNKMCGVTITAPRATLTSIALTTTVMIVGSLLFPDKNKPVTQ